MYRLILLLSVSFFISCTNTDSKKTTGPIAVQGPQSSNPDKFINEINRDKKSKIDSDSLLNGLAYIQIGKQKWTKYNLDLSVFQNGDVVQEAESIDDWKKCCDENIPAWCYMQNKSEYNFTFGKIYNRAAIEDKRGLLPKGWKIPSSEDWNELKSYSKANVCALQSKTGWNHLFDKTKTSAFDAYPAGMRMAPAMFILDFKEPIALWWCKSENLDVLSFKLTEQETKIDKVIYHPEYVGLSIRCIYSN